ncbi:hypothetical protein ACH5RR_030482 [Cinchona calisaya]|uniref:F-box associated beta-propeller type 1 domain-containing protein n=1 Tax=Cinchona calisaya TaxID=153742 RepID=A0ABD2YW11_9GENT
MEEAQESGGSMELRLNGSNPSSSSLLGYFVKTYSPSLDGFAENTRRSLERAQFIYVSEQGKELKEGNWSNFDESLSFLGEASIDIVGSCNGFLLCCIPGSVNEKGNLDYIICNPVTREFRRLPRPHKAYYCVAVAFRLKGDGDGDGDGATSLNDIHYEVIRAGVLDRQFTTKLEMDTYSSVTNSWTEVSAVSDSSSFILRGCNTPACMIGEVIYWSAFEPAVFANRPSARSAILAYDCTVDKDAEVWVLEDCKTEWKLKHRRTFMEINHHNYTRISDDYLVLLGFHPHNPQLLLLSSGGIPYWYDFESKKLSLVGGGYIWSFYPQQYFLYERPFSLPLDD